MLFNPILTPWYMYMRVNEKCTCGTDTQLQASWKQWTQKLATLVIALCVILVKCLSRAADVGPQSVYIKLLLNEEIKKIKLARERDRDLGALTLNVWGGVHSHTILHTSIRNSHVYTLYMQLQCTCICIHSTSVACNHTCTSHIVAHVHVVLWEVLIPRAEYMMYPPTT